MLSYEWRGHGVVYVGDAKINIITEHRLYRKTFAIITHTTLALFLDSLIMATCMLDIQGPIFQVGLPIFSSLPVSAWFVAQTASDWVIKYRKCHATSNISLRLKTTQELFTHGYVPRRFAEYPYFRDLKKTDKFCYRFLLIIAVKVDPDPRLAVISSAKVEKTWLVIPVLIPIDIEITKPISQFGF